MARRRTPLFLKRRGYRRRRLRDAARLLPVLGGFLFLLPILWSSGPGTATGTAPDGVYLFVVWIGLVVVAAALSPGLVSDGAEDDGPDGEAR